MPGTELLEGVGSLVVYLSPEEVAALTKTEQLQYELAKVEATLAANIQNLSQARRCAQLTARHSQIRKELYPEEE